MERPPFIKRHAVAIYFVLTFALSWGVWVLLTGAAPLRADPRVTLIIFVAPVAPAIAGLLMTGLTAGRTGYRELAARLFRWRVQPRWYGAAILPAPFVAILTTVLLALSARSAGLLPVPGPGGQLLAGLAGGLIVGLCEELGWTGFATPRLRARQGVLATGLLVGVVWGAWHAPLFLRHDSFAGALPLVLLLVQLISWLPAVRILMVWVYDRTGSLFVAVVMHASLTATTIIIPPAAMSDLLSVTSILVSAAIWWILAAAAAVAQSRRRGAF